ncbi:MAG: dihydrolipoamide acetyltransferase family protein [Ktedonobacteraceae bacterium]
MATDVILPALGMSQDTGKIVQWLKAEGEQVVKGEPLAEIETDKATVEIESPADGMLTRVSAAAGDDVPVGQVIAAILATGEVSPVQAAKETRQPEMDAITRAPSASPLASRVAAEHNLDLSLVKASGRRIHKADVLTHLQSQDDAGAQNRTPTGNVGAQNRTSTARLAMASPKARRLAFEQGKDLAAIKGSGPGGAVLATDVLAAVVQTQSAPVEYSEVVPATELSEAMVNGTNDLAVSNVWRIMAERTTQGWTSVPHFYLVREVNVSRLIAWREHVLKRSAEKVTYTDLLVKIVAAALRMHPRVNASWNEGKITLKQEVHVGLAVAVEEGLVVPVIQRADALSLGEIARQRMELVAKAQSGKLRLQDISGGTFTISNLGMYNVDAFNAIINQPQAAILAVGRIAERVVPVNRQPAIQPMMVLTLSCDHRAVDGSRGAQFLDSVATLIEEPLGLLG